MLLQQIKTQLNIQGFNFQESKDKDGNVSTEWVRHFDSTQRISVSMPIAVAEQLTKNKEMENLVLTSKVTRLGAKGAYDAYMILAVDDIKYSF